MQNDKASFWADIKNYEDRLAEAPDSLLFARLAEVYLKVGLVDDAIHTARRGLELHPGFVAGQRVLAMACNAKGLHDECREALIKVTMALPEDGEAQKMLGRLLAANGFVDAAIRAYRTVLDFYPEDLECQAELEALERIALASRPETGQEEAEPLVGTGITVDGMDAEFAAFEDECEESEEIIEDVEILDVEDPDLPDMEEVERDAAEPSGSDSAQSDPFSTMTLAELYLKQGFTEKALEIYRNLLANDPANATLRLRVAELNQDVDTGMTGIDVSSSNGDSAHEVSIQERSSTVMDAPAAGAADNTIAILEGWLDNIGRIKGCRCGTL
jgi:tetratricopeptide (TPR) repeat protein